MSPDDKNWYYLELPFLFVGYFECEYCHRPIEVHTRSADLKVEQDWDDYTFDIHCACGWGKAQYPGRKAVYKFVVEWNRKVRSMNHSDT